MSRRRALLFLFVSLLMPGVILAAGPRLQGGQDGQVKGGELTLAAPILTERGTITSGDGSFIYTSDVLEAPLPFNALVASWALTGEDEHGLDDEHGPEIAIRTGRAGRWSEWFVLHADHDLTLPEDKVVTGPFVTVPAAERWHDQVQLRITPEAEHAHAAPAETPLSEAAATFEALGVEEIRLVFIDSTAGPTTTEILADQPAMAPQAGAANDVIEPTDVYPKPPVISRAQWCTDSRCHYSDGLRYVPVTHLLVHHTVTSSDADSAATMRAIWYYHAITRGWGDIGYNYLVDMEGVLFEGHLGGDNVVGTHAAAANAGSMALSFIGNFNETNAPEMMIESATRLLAWKADQRNIDVYNASRPPYMNWGLPHLAGHRDVYGTTDCPGHTVHALLPSIRDEVAQRIDLTPTYDYYDELSPEANFSQSAVNWWTGPRNCGYNSHAYYTWTVTETEKSTNWAQWRPEISAPGRYELSIYAPYCYTDSRDATHAVYYVVHANGASAVVVNQDESLGLWAPLGEYEFEAGTEGRVILTDLMWAGGSADQALWFDAIRLLYRQPTLIDPRPLPDSLHGTEPVSFRWDVANRASLITQTFQLAADAAFSQTITTEAIPVDTNAASHLLPHDGAFYWRILFHNTREETVTSPGVRIYRDTIPPTSSVHLLLALPGGRYHAAWNGEDAVSGIVSYNVDYRADEESTWTRWLTNTSRTEATLSLPVLGGPYWFRSQAVDAAGNVEAAHEDPGDISTTEATFLTHEYLLPLMTREK
ncbi:MAG: N-acetylmuramoyl-L-alanine amidase [Candidatus Promineifilaceae bacterium]|nr:N-acetylmuramoyl-L-alanine amidase [Candidatus Promineifilaceae bacterium]